MTRGTRFSARGGAANPDVCRGLPSRSRDRAGPSGQPPHPKNGASGTDMRSHSANRVLAEVYGPGPGRPNPAPAGCPQARWAPPIHDWAPARLLGAVMGGGSTPMSPFAIGLLAAAVVAVAGRPRPTPSQHRSAEWPVNPVTVVRGFEPHERFGPGHRGWIWLQRPVSWSDQHCREWSPSPGRSPVALQWWSTTEATCERPTCRWRPTVRESATRSPAGSRSGGWPSTGTAGRRPACTGAPAR